MTSDRKCPDVFEPGALECLGCSEWLICGWAYCNSQEKTVVQNFKNEQK